VPPHTSTSSYFVSSSISFLAVFLTAGKSDPDPELYDISFLRYGIVFNTLYFIGLE
jgi:hypothetical protein